MQAASEEEASPAAQESPATTIRGVVHTNVQLIQVPFHEDKPSASVMAASNLRNELKKAGSDLVAEAVPFAQLQNYPQTLIIVDAETVQPAKEVAPEAQFEEVSKLYEQNQYNKLLDKVN